MGEIDVVFWGNGNLRIYRLYRTRAKHMHVPSQEGFLFMSSRLFVYELQFVNIYKHFSRDCCSPNGIHTLYIIVFRCPYICVFIGGNDLFSETPSIYRFVRVQPADI